MYVRLAFAVAAHLEPDILIVDEVLAVGDVSFQKKCLGKMEEVGRLGRTVLFVSHNMGAISHLCGTCIHLESGVLVSQGTPAVLIPQYLHAPASNEAQQRWEVAEAPGDETLRLAGVRVCQPPGTPSGTLDIGKAFDVEIETDLLTPVDELGIGLRFTSASGQVVIHTVDLIKGERVSSAPVRLRSSWRLEANLLNVGNYFLTVGAHVPYRKQVFFMDSVLAIAVQNPTGQYGRFRLKDWTGLLGPWVGEWKTEVASE